MTFVRVRLKKMMKHEAKKNIDDKGKLTLKFTGSFKYYPSGLICVKTPLKVWFYFRVVWQELILD